MMMNKSQMLWLFTVRSKANAPYELMVKLFQQVLQRLQWSQQRSQIFIHWLDVLSLSLAHFLKTSISP